MEKLVSIIVPVYNTEKYIERTIQAVLEQTYTNWELLLLDDGSTDSSLSICQKWASQDNRIIVSSHDNCGVALTRELGFKKAKGELITFLDSDDVIDKDFIEKLARAIVKNDADIVCCNCIDYDGINKSIENDEIITDKSILMDAFFNKKRYAYCIWAKMYRKESIASVEFPKNMKYAEDTLFVTKCFQKVQKIFLLDYAGYHYTDNPNGAMRKKSGIQQGQDNLLLLDYVNSLCEKQCSSKSTMIDKNITAVLFNMICAGAEMNRSLWKNDIKNIRKSIRKYKGKILLNFRGIVIRLFYYCPFIIYILLCTKKKIGMIGW